MVSVALVLLLGKSPVAELDRLAKARDEKSLTGLLVSAPEGLSPFRVLKTGGAYGTGRHGWQALPLQVGDQSHVVFTTRLTSEDIGDLLFARSGEKLQYVPEADDLGVRIARHRLDVSFDIKARRAMIRDRVSFNNLAGQPGHFVVRFTPNYRMRKVTDADGRTVNFAQAGGVVALPRPSSRQFSYLMEYDAIVDQPEFAGAITDREASLTNDYWYPMIARFPAPFDLTVRPPKGWTAVGQGVQVDDQETPTGRVTRFRMDMPVVYYSLTAAPFRSFSATNRGHRFNIWSQRLDEDQMRMQPELFGPIVQYYKKAFGPFPFDSYGAVDSETYGGGALEAYSYATYGGEWLPAADAHEPSHTYWGGVINNTYLRSFWNESFAAYADGLCHREMEVGNQEERRLAFIQDGNASLVYNQGTCATAGVFAGPIASTLGYGKGGQVLQMLELAIGTDKLLEAMREWLRTHPKGQPGEWEDFEAVVARTVPGFETKRFFDDWIRRPGFARFTIEPPTFADGALRFKVAFTGESFYMPLEVLLRYPDGREVTQTVIVREGGESRLGTTQKPSLVSFDPHRRLVRMIPGNEVPVSVTGMMGRSKRITDPKKRTYLANLGGTNQGGELPDDLDGLFIVGHPGTMPRLKALCDRVGFRVEGNKLTYRGTTIDLSDGAALAVVDLAGGKQCLIGLGNIKSELSIGRARLALTDGYGRLIRGVTEPKRSGNLTFPL